jgi:hypothetical protein
MVTKSYHNYTFYGLLYDAIILWTLRWLMYWKAYVRKWCWPNGSIILVFPMRDWWNLRIIGGSKAIRTDHTDGELRGQRVSSVQRPANELYMILLSTFVNNCQYNTFWLRRRPDAITNVSHRRYICKCNICNCGSCRVCRCLYDLAPYKIPTA